MTSSYTFCLMLANIIIVVGKIVESRTLVKARLTVLYKEDKFRTR